MYDNNEYEFSLLENPVQRQVFLQPGVGFCCASCVVKDAVKCSFECLSVVHHTCRKHSLGVGDGGIIK